MKMALYNTPSGSILLHRLVVEVAEVIADCDSIKSRSFQIPLIPGINNCCTLYIDVVYMSWAEMFHPKNE